MIRPRHETEVIRLRVGEITGELRDTLRELGFSGEEVAGLALCAERAALEYALCLGREGSLTTTAAHRNGRRRDDTSEKASHRA